MVCGVCEDEKAVDLVAREYGYVVVSHMKTALKGLC
jgi:hypothetical protein